MRLKVLQLEPWMKRIYRDRGVPILNEIPPVLNRNGWYMRGKESWFELDGRAYTNDSLAAQFRYEMKGYDHVPYNKELARLVSLLVYKLPRRHQRKYLKELTYFHYVPSPQSRLAFFKHRKRILDRMKEHGWDLKEVCSI